MTEIEKYEVVKGEVVEEDTFILDPDALPLGEEEMWRSFEVTREKLRDIAFANGKGGMVVCECADCENART